MIKTSLAILCAAVLLGGCVYDREPADGYSTYDRERDLARERDRARERAWERERARERELAWERERDRARERERALERERTRPGEPVRLHDGSGRPMQAALPPSDRVRTEELGTLSPGSGTPGPEADARPPARATPSPTRITTGNQRLFVQAASFVTREQAERARRAVAEHGPTRIYTAYVDDQLRYRVRIGPMASAERSERVRAALIRRGYGDAIVVRD